MNPQVISDLIDLAIALGKAYRGGGDVAQILLTIVRKGVRAWEDQTGKTLNPDLIRAEKAI